MIARGWLLILLALSMPAGALDLKELKNKLNDLNQPAAPGSQTPGGTGLSQFSAQDQAESLRQALEQGAEASVSSLARTDGYLGNAKVHIPLPDNLQKADKALRKSGMGKYPDELITAMNRAAEAAVPEAKSLLAGAIKNMSVADAKNILTGGDDAATRYFRSNTETELAGKFKPIVSNAMRQVNLAEKYNRFASKGARLGLMDKRDAELDGYVTRKAMDGLFLLMAEQEKAIRTNPLQATGGLAKKIFSALKR